MFKITLLLLAASMLLFAQTADAHTITKQQCYAAAKVAGPYQSPAWRNALRKCRKYQKAHAWNHRCGGVVKTIHCIFGRQGARAVRVARCESGLRVNARGPNDEFGNPREGLWQFGTAERRAYGYGSNALDQTRGAFRYWKESGWGPWEASRHCWG